MSVLLGTTFCPRRRAWRLAHLQADQAGLRVLDCLTCLDRRTGTGDLPPGLCHLLHDPQPARLHDETECLPAGDQGDYRQALDARQGGRADKRRMEGFSSRSISPRIQVEFSRRMLEDIEQVFTQDMVQPVRTPNGHTHAAV